MKTATRSVEAEILTAAANGDAKRFLELCNLHGKDYCQTIVRMKGSRTRPMAAMSVSGSGSGRSVGSAAPTRPTPTAKAQEAGPVNRVVITRECWRDMMTALNNWWDSRETGAAMLASRDGDTVTLHAAAQPYIGDVRNVDAMSVKDGAGYAMEEARAHLGQVYGAHWHSHSPGGKAIPSEPDSFAYGLRVREELGNLFVGVITVPSEDGSRFEDVKAYLFDGKRTTPVNLEIRAEASPICARCHNALDNGEMFLLSGNGTTQSCGDCLASGDVVIESIPPGLSLPQHSGAVWAEG